MTWRHPAKMMAVEVFLQAVTKLMFYTVNSCRVTTCLENLEMSGNLKHVMEMSGILLTVRELSGECQGKNLVREKCPKSVHYSLNICIHMGI